ncbi:50S ribosomal protein L4 [candidate division WWE3 bacterium RIFOXYC1_FULL_39_7]|uniref:Large ribosomal subunit protein uL4 n=2 Tax=Katanobacteria TaxID=422282 RepID=A0A1F4X438_UNCKA|nr:MAG: 50S ribosomal protein L4 [candidate division WWE3 bacterium RIFOXYC1_FULL_39_7]OGC76470.1 MAG: 50S ribosomal protein L4 [candidate division WWE3 bacterium RIFOXYD1_FULL_39_9]
MKVNLVDKKGKILEEITLAKDVFGAKVSNQLLSQYIQVHMNNSRNGNSSTKTRGEVSGSGAKPWAQKGTGRARVGSKRNPIWTHGGISHGPKPKVWNVQLPKKVVKLALSKALSEKAALNKFTVVDGFDFKKPDTKEALAFLKSTSAGKRVLVVAEKSDAVLYKSFRNISGARIKTVAFLNAFDVFKADSVYFDKGALKVLEAKYKETKK